MNTNEKICNLPEFGSTSFELNSLAPKVFTKAKAPMTPICLYFSLGFDNCF